MLTLMQSRRSIRDCSQLQRSYWVLEQPAENELQPKF